MQGTEVTQTTAKTNSSQPMGKHVCTSTNYFSMYVVGSTYHQTANQLSIIIPLFLLRIQQKQHQSNDTALI